ncbi:MAG: hypothetical protein KA473_03350 [Anaerolineales bacterium]|nr:hypothetical protein [Anaerolineales bacterium]MBP6208446.1 hypothetical protein [Anaerolineales bacterium]
MKKIFAVIIYILLLTGCDAWSVAPQPFPVWTPIPSRTPGVVTATPIILSPTPGEIAAPSLTFTPVSISTNTETPSPVATLPPATPTETPTNIPVQSVSVDILGCNTSIDISHGMGEVTNAYVTVKNTGNVDLPNTCSLLRALDEDREHPDKKICVPNLPVQNQVTLKLTVDSVYQQSTIIQVDTSSNDVLLLRVDRQSCTDIGLFGGEPTDLGVIKPTQ